MEPAGEKLASAERNRLILVRTLGIVSWLFAAERTLVGLALLQAGVGSGPAGPATFGTASLAHAALLLAAGAALIRDARWAWAPALAAAAVAAIFSAVEAAMSNWTCAAVDAAYVLIAAATLARKRHSP